MTSLLVKRTTRRYLGALLHAEYDEYMAEERECRGALFVFGLGHQPLAGIVCRDSAGAPVRQHGALTVRFSFSPTAVLNLEPREVGVGFDLLDEWHLREDKSDRHPDAK